MSIEPRIEERVVAALRALPPQRQGEVLDFAEFLKRRPVADAEPKQLRPFGLCAGEFRVPDDFDAPLPDDVADLFEAP